MPGRPGPVMKKWPTIDDLLGWYLFCALDSIEHPGPEHITNWIIEFQSRPALHWHKFLWDQKILEFQLLFFPPHPQQEQFESERKDTTDHA